MVEKSYNFKNAFKYDSEDLKAVIEEVDPGNTSMTQEMLDFIPEEKVLKYGGSPIRLIFFDDAYTEDEKAKLKDFKDHCKNNGLPIPLVDEELMRFLYVQKFKIERTLDALKMRIEFRKTWPL